MVVLVPVYMTLSKSFFSSISKIFNSPVLMTWANLLSKTLGLALLLPAVLTTFSENDIILWYVLVTMVGIGLLFDLGFTPTFIRFVAYAKAGASLEDMTEVGKKNTVKDTSDKVLSNDLSYILGILSKNYLVLSLIAFALLFFLGSFLVLKPITQSSDILFGWLSWFVVICTTSFLLFGNKYVAILQGLGLIAENQKAMMVTSVTATFIASIALFLGGNLLLVISLYQGISSLSFFLNRRLVRKYVPNYFEGKTQEVLPIEISLSLNKLKKVVFSSAWKSAVGILMSVGLIHLSALAAANYLSTSDAAGYLLALQLIRAISSFSQAPFYTKIPMLAGLFANQNEYELRKVSFKAELQSLSFFTFSCLICGVLFPLAEGIFSFNTPLPDQNVWVLLALGILIERSGAMHIQIYSLTNNILWHYINGITGICMIIVFLSLINTQGVLTFPLSILISYAVFYYPISSFYACKVVGKKYIVKQFAFLALFLSLLLLWRLFY
jgi:hypothetical protein